MTQLAESGSIFFRDEYLQSYRVSWVTTQAGNRTLLDFTTIVSTPFVYGTPVTGKVVNKKVFKDGMCQIIRQVFAVNDDGYDIIAEGTTFTTCEVPTSYDCEEPPSDPFAYHYDDAILDAVIITVVDGSRFSDPDGDLLVFFSDFGSDFFIPLAVPEEFDVHNVWGDDLDIREGEANFIEPITLSGIEFNPRVDLIGKAVIDTSVSVQFALTAMGVCRIIADAPTTLVFESSSAIIPVSLIGGDSSLVFDSTATFISAIAIDAVGSLIFSSTAQPTLIVYTGVTSLDVTFTTSVSAIDGETMSEYVINAVRDVGLVRYDSTNSDRAANAAFNTPAIQEVISQNRPEYGLFFPAGRYYIDTPLVTPLQVGSPILRGPGAPSQDINLISLYTTGDTVFGLITEFAWHNADPGLTITNATNATPIVITSAGHGFSAGEEVEVYDVVGNFAANGIFIVGPTTTDTFALTNHDGTNVAGTGAYTGGGYCYRRHDRCIIQASSYGAIYDGISFNGRDKVRNATYHYVLSATNDSNEVVMTIANSKGGSAIAHNLTNGEEVYINGVEGNTIINGKHYVTVLSSTTFKLNNVYGNGAYVANTGLIALTARLGRVLPAAIVDAMLVGSPVTHGKANYNNNSFCGFDRCFWAIPQGVFLNGTQTANNSDHMCINGYTRMNDSRTFVRCENNQSVNWTINHLQVSQLLIPGWIIQNESPLFVEWENVPTVFDYVISGGKLQMNHLTILNGGGIILRVDSGANNAARFQFNHISVDGGTVCDSYFITAATAGPPAQMTTGVAHNLQTGDRVEIANATGMTNINGRHRVTVVNSTTFTLDGVTGVGTYNASSGEVWNTLNAIEPPFVMVQMERESTISVRMAGIMKPYHNRPIVYPVGNFYDIQIDMMSLSWVDQAAWPIGGVKPYDVCMGYKPRVTPDVWWHFADPDPDGDLPDDGTLLSTIYNKGDGTVTNLLTQVTPSDQAAFAHDSIHHRPALEFDGGYYMADNAIGPGESELNVEVAFWVETNGTSIRTIASVSGGTNQHSWCLSVLANYTINFRISTTGSATASTISLTSDIPVVDKQQAYVRAYFIGGTGGTGIVGVEVNGILKTASHSTATLYSPTANLYIGADHLSTTLTRQFAGRLYDIKIDTTIPDEEELAWRRDVIAAQIGAPIVVQANPKNAPGVHSN